MTMAAVIGACRHIVWTWITYDEMRTVTARASGSFHSLEPPTRRKTSPTTQPTRTLIMRLRNMRCASRTWGSEAATMDAIDQIGFVSAMWRSRYQRIAVAMKTLIANRTPSRSRLANAGHLTIASRSPWRAARRAPGRAWTARPYRDRTAGGNERSTRGSDGKELPRVLEETRVGHCARQLPPQRFRGPRS